MKASLWPLCLLILITPFTPFLDMESSKAFYSSSNGFESTSFYDFFYNYGFIPADMVGITALIVLIFTFFRPQWKQLRAPALVLFLTLVLGAGLVVHLALKDYWGRPRPKQVLEFGGSQAFRPYYVPELFANKEPSKSFPCGHCSTGFYFFCVACIGWKERNFLLVWMGTLLALGLGFLLSLTRLAQGGHFFSDTLASAFIMWLTSYWCTRVVYQRLR